MFVPVATSAAPRPDAVQFDVSREGLATFNLRGERMDLLDLEEFARQPPSMEDLHSWSSVQYQLDGRVAASLSFPVANAEGSGESKLLVYDTARYFDRREGPGLVLRWGVSVRFTVEYKVGEGQGGLNIGAIVAKAEAQRSSAFASLEARGYRGNDLWSVIPEPQPLDAHSYAKYMQGTTVVQQRMEAHPEKLVPVVLASESEPPQLRLAPKDLEGSFVRTYVAYMISKGQTRSTTLDQWPGETEQSRLVDSVYSDYVGGADVDEPPEELVAQLSRFMPDDLVFELERRWARDVALGNDS